ncbi:MAG: transcriptional repressor [Planctomycetes bacterium]|nr:transcriptional repressor [Planctomycetota bacterium]
MSRRIPHAELVDRLVRNDIRPSAQRLAIAEYVLATDEHPTADQVFRKVTERHPAVSRATVYNTLQTFVSKGLLRALVLSEGSVAYDPNTERHHHFVDDETGAIEDIPWSAIKVGRVDQLPEIDVREFSVVVRGRRRAE